MTSFHRKTLAALAVAAALAGCGGNDGDGAPAAQNTPAPPPAATSGVPASAQQSVAGLLAFLNALIDGTSETSEPILIGDAVLPTSEVD